jgi:hypothetical protein
MTYIITSFSTCISIIVVLNILKMNNINLCKNLIANALEIILSQKMPFPKLIEVAE